MQISACVEPCGLIKEAQVPNGFLELYAGVSADDTHPEARETLVDHHTLLSTLNKVYESLLQT